MANQKEENTENLKLSIVKETHETGDECNPNHCKLGLVTPQFSKDAKVPFLEKGSKTLVFKKENITFASNGSNRHKYTQEDQDELINKMVEKANLEENMS